MAAKKQNKIPKRGSVERTSTELRRTGRREQKQGPKKEKKVQTPLARMIAQLKESGLTRADANANKLRPMTGEQSEDLNLSRTGPGFQIPYFNAAGEELTMFRYRYFDVEVMKGFAAGSKLRKYDQPRDTDPEIYFPQGLPWEEIQQDTNISLFITEGELKAIKACKEGFITVAPGGVFSFQRKARFQKMLPALAEFDWKGRKVYIVYDSDSVSNPMVRLAENRLARVLTDAGAIVYIVRIPPDGDKKVGLDDYLVKHGKKAYQALLDATEEWGPSAILHEINSQFAYNRADSTVVELPTEERPELRIYRTSVCVNEVMANLTFTETIDGKEKVRPAGKAWLASPSRLEIERIDNRPGEPLITRDRCLNTWTGWDYEPELGDTSLFEDLINYVFQNAEPKHKRWFLQWLAYPLQHPGAKLNTACVLWSRYAGVGKSLLGYIVGRIYGRYFVEITKENLTGRFNALWANSLFCVGSEITADGAGRSSADFLKHIITSKELVIEEKYLPQRRQTNRANYYFTTNNEDAFFIDPLERRYFIHEIVGAPRPASFYKPYDAWLKLKPENDELTPALFAHLLSIDTADFNPNAAAPRTRSLEAMVDAGLSVPAAWCVELRNVPENVLSTAGTLYTTEQLHLEFMSRNDRSTLTVKGLARELRNAGFRMVNDGNPVNLPDRDLRPRLWAVRDIIRLNAMKTPQIAQRFVDENPPHVSKFGRRA